MKPNNTLVFLTSCLFILFGLTGRVSSQIDHFVKVDFDQSNLVHGAIIDVPVKMTGNQIHNFRHVIKYDHEVLTYMGDPIGVPGGTGYTIPPTSKLYSPFNPNPLVTNDNFANYPGAIYIAFTTTGIAINYSDEVVYILHFTYNGGATNFTWWNEATITPPATTPGLGCFLKNAQNATPAYWLGRTGWQVTGNGTVSGTSPILTSVPGGGDWNTPSTWVENAGGGTKVPGVIYDVIITQNPVTINAATAKCHHLTINAGGKLTLNAGKTLNPTGTFLIQSGGSFIDQNLTNSNNLAATVKRTITGNYPGSGLPTPSTIWHYVSSPVSNGTIGVFLGCLMNKWTEGSTIYGGNWDTLCLPLTIPLEIGRGYSVAAFPAFGDASFTGPLNTGNVLLTGLSNSSPSNTAFGYHLLGNPYPSALRWDSSIPLTNMDGAIYLWNGTNYTSKIPDDNYEIQPEQGFFIHANASGGSVTLLNSNRVHSNGAYLKSSTLNALTLMVEGNQMADETSIRFNESATSGFDGNYDAFKLYGVYNCPQIFSILPEFNLSINSLPSITSQSVVPVGFKSGLGGSFTITASGFESFAAGTEFYLTDLFTGQTQNLTVNPVYTFSASPANPEHRFDITFSPVGLSDDPQSVNFRIYSAERSVFVNVPSQVQGDILVYNMLGTLIAKKTIEPEKLNKIEIDAVQGYYLVKVVSEKASAIEKVFIR